MGTDQYVFRNGRTELGNELRKKCNKANIGFYTHITPAEIQRSNKTKNILYWADIAYDPSHWVAINNACAKSGKYLHVITENFIDLDNLSNVTFTEHLELISLFAAYSSRITPQSAPSKLYNCFIQRVESVRQSWFYFLHLNELLDKGYVSFLLRQMTEYSALNGVELFDYIHNTYNLGVLPHFQEAYQKLRSQVPYKNFIESFDLTPLIEDSKYSLVLETYATETDVGYWCFSEKAIRALLTPTIPLIFGQKHMISHFQRAGFIINHHQDLDGLSWQERQQALLTILKEDSINCSANEISDIVAHNRHTVSTFKSRLLQSNYFDKVFDCI